MHTNRINKVSVESIAKFLDTRSDLIKHNTLLTSICRREREKRKKAVLRTHKTEDVCEI